MIRTLLLLLLALVAVAFFGEGKVSAQNSSVYPPMLISVPFIPQVAPGDWGNTKNCGQTCSVMLDSYFNGGSPSPAKISAADLWLATRFNDSRYNNANGYYTSATGRQELPKLLMEKYALQTRVATGSNVCEILTQVYQGRPTIVSVRISGGRLVSSGGVVHWAMCVGWNARDRKVVINDPGTSSGRYIQYAEADFVASWNAAGRTMVSAWR